MNALSGRRVVVTRPKGQAAGLAQLIRAEGGDPVCIPALEIRDLEDSAPFNAVADRLASFDLAIFVSRNAVSKALDLLRARRSGPWPERLRVATVGQGSRADLEARGFSAVIAPPAQPDSEALLALPELAESAMRGKRVVIFRGDGGRRLLGDTLGERGAFVEYAACYRRVRPAGGAAARDAWAGGVDAVTVSSAEGLYSFLEMLGDNASLELSTVPLFVPHPRIAEEAARRGMGRTIVAGTRDEDMASALVAYFRGAG